MKDAPKVRFVTRRSQEKARELSDVKFQSLEKIYFFFKNH